VAVSSLINAVSFSSARTMKRWTTRLSFHAPVRLIRCRPTAHPGGLRLCRSALAGSIPAPACFDRNDQFRHTGENAFVTQANGFVFAADTAIISGLYLSVVLQNVGSNRFR
jgi:hypothetical protein